MRRPSTTNANVMTMNVTMMTRTIQSRRPNGRGRQPPLSIAGSTSWRGSRTMIKVAIGPRNSEIRNHSPDTRQVSGGHIPDEDSCRCYRHAEQAALPFRAGRHRTDRHRGCRRGPRTTGIAASRETDTEASPVDLGPASPSAPARRPREASSAGGLGLRCYASHATLAPMSDDQLDRRLAAASDRLAGLGNPPSERWPMDVRLAIIERDRPLPLRGLVARVQVVIERWRRRWAELDEASRGEPGVHVTLGRLTAAFDPGTA